jgi:hypothetical protein
MKKPDKPIPDVPDQLFFDYESGSGTFMDPGPPDPQRSSVAPPTAKLQKPDVRPVKISTSEPPAPMQARIQSFMTESRAGDLFMQVARDLRPGQIKRVKMVYKPFRATLYSFKIGKSGVASVKFHVSFRTASDAVVEQAARLMLTRRRNERKLIRRVEYDQFVRSMPSTDFELPGAPRARRVSIPGPGVHRSLEDSFNRVNSEYFQSQLQQPELCWSPVHARRVLGSYQERSDRLIISRVFDSPNVPIFVLDYLMYHELLHKFLGIGRRNDGKRCMHGKEFREIEKQFKHFAQAQQFLRTLKA